MFALLAVGILLVRPEPGPVTVSADDRARATELVHQLGSDSFFDRDRAHRDLWSMGRHAMPALKVGSRTDPDPEVRRRCEMLLPRAEALDFDSRMLAFLADAKDQFQHGIPGWEKFRALVGSEPNARAIYAEMFRSKENRALLEAIDIRDDLPVPPIVDAALVGTLAFIAQPKRGQLSQRVINRKQEIYQRMYGRAFNGRATNEDRYDPTPEDVATLLFCDTILGDSGAAIVVGVRTATYQMLLLRPRVRQAFEVERTGLAFKKLTVRWLDSRTSAAGLYQGMTLIAMLGTSLELTDGARYAAKLFAVEGATTLHRAMAATTIGKLGTKDDAKYLVPLLNDATAVRNVVGGSDEIQLRDVALAMAAHLTGHGPDAVGLRNQIAGDSAKYSYWNYSFYSAVYRTKGFAKWAELEPKLTPLEVKKLLPGQEPK